MQNLTLPTIKALESRTVQTALFSLIVTLIVTYIPELESMQDAMLDILTITFGAAAVRMMAAGVANEYKANV